jgi:hypothetical protein
MKAAGRAQKDMNAAGRAQIMELHSKGKSPAQIKNNYLLTDYGLSEDAVLDIIREAKERNHFQSSEEEEREQVLAIFREAKERPAQGREEKAREQEVKQEEKQEYIGEPARSVRGEGVARPNFSESCADERVLEARVNEVNEVDERPSAEKRIQELEREVESKSSQITVLQQALASLIRRVETLELTKGTQEGKTSALSPPRRKEEPGGRGGGSLRSMAHTAGSPQERGRERERETERETERERERRGGAEFRMLSKHASSLRSSLTVGGGGVGGERYLIYY